MNQIIFKSKQLRLLFMSLMISMMMGTSVFADGGAYILTEGDFSINADSGTLVTYTGSATHLNIPSTVSGITVTGLGTSLFNYNLSLASVTMPDTIVTIGNNAFSECTNLTSITLSRNLVSLGSFTFHYCQNLTSIVLPSTLTTIGSGCFSNCTSLMYLNIPDSVTSIGSIAFSGTRSLSSLTIPRTVTNLTNAFDEYNGAALEPDEAKPVIPVVIYVYSGSAAETEVIASGLNYVVIDESSSNGSTGNRPGRPDNQPTYTYHTLSAIYNECGYVTATTSTPYAGEVVTFSVHPYDYFWVSAIYVYTPSGQIISFDYDSYKNEFSFTQPADDVVISVEYGFSGYTVSTASTSNGTLSVSNTSPQAGERVTIKASPSTGYRVNTVTATTSFGYNIPVGYDSVNGEYAFIQPYSGVTVSATFTNTSGTTYVPFVIPNNNGSAVVSKTNPTAGEVVQITLTPSEGYAALKVSVTESTGGIVPVTKLSDTLYQFIQPSSRAVIEVFYYYTTHVTQYFDDVTVSNTYAPYISYVLDRGWMTGTTSSTFEPNTTITRGMAAVIFAHLSQENIPTATSSSFWDCYTGQWYSDAVEWCKSRSIVSGYENGSFGLNDPITKEQLATMMYGFARHYGLSTYAYYPEFICSFVDADDTLEYAFIPMTWSLSYSYLRGSGTNVLTPSQNINRGEMARMLSQFFEGTTNYQSIATNGWTALVEPEFVNISQSA